MSLADSDLVTVYANDTLVVTNEQAQTVVTPEEVTHVVDIGKQGPPGATGPAGPPGSGSGVIEINFAFGDATPASLVTALAGKMIYGVKVHVKVPFDGVGAQVTIGDVGDLDRLMMATENDLTSVGSSETNPAFAYGSDTALLLSITPGAGASQGSGLVTLNIQQ